jgi:hypothetical protein
MHMHMHVYASLSLQLVVLNTVRVSPEQLSRSSKIKVLSVGALLANLIKVGVDVGVVVDVGVRVFRCAGVGVGVGVGVWVCWIPVALLGTPNSDQQSASEQHYVFDKLL